MVKCHHFHFDDKVGVFCFKFILLACPCKLVVSIVVLSSCPERIKLVCLELKRDSSPFLKENF